MNTNRITHLNREGFDKQSWLNEADSHFESAKMLCLAKKRRKTLLKSSEQRKKSEYIKKMEAATHSSMLLLGYSVELYLKAGLTQMYKGCSKELFSTEIKNNKIHGHNLSTIAEEIEFPGLDSLCRDQLDYLKDVLLREGRYPFLSNTSIENIKNLNDRAFKFWSDKEFNELLKLTESIRNYVLRIDQDSVNPVTHASFDIDHDGYIAFRMGGNLSARITVKYSSVQIQNNENNPNNLKTLILSSVPNSVLALFWDKAILREVKK